MLLVKKINSNYNKLIFIFKMNLIMINNFYSKLKKFIYICNENYNIFRKIPLISYFEHNIYLVIYFLYHAIVQARMGSKRLPGKSLKKYNNITPLEVLIKRIQKIRDIKLIIIATTKLKKDDYLKICKKLK